MANSSNPLSWLNGLLVGLKQLTVGGQGVNVPVLSATQPPVDTINFIGSTVAYNPATNAYDVTTSSAGSVVGIFFASLASTTASVDKQFVFLTGYSAKGDGGGGTFAWDSASTATADSGTVSVGPGGSGVPGRWVRIFSGEFNVRWFGATGNGSSDDTSAIEATIAAALAANTLSATVYFPSGTYMTTGIALSVSTSSGLTIRGASPQAYNGHNGSILKMSGTGNLLAVQGIHVHIEDMWLHGNNLATNTLSLQYLTALTRFDRCMISHVGSTVLAGTFTATNGSAVVTTSVSQAGGAVERGQGIVLSTESGYLYYTIADYNSTSITLAFAYLGTNGTGTATVFGNLVDIPGTLEVDTVTFDHCQIVQDPANSAAFCNACVHTRNGNASNILFDKCNLQGAYYAVFNVTGGISVRDSSAYQISCAVYAFEGAYYGTTLDHFYTEGGSFPFLLEMNTTFGPSVVHPLKVTNCSMGTVGGQTQNTVQLLCKQPVILDGCLLTGNVVASPEATYGIYPPTVRACSFGWSAVSGMNVPSNPGPCGVNGTFVNIEDCVFPNGYANAGPFHGTTTYSQKQSGPLNVQAFGAVADAFTISDVSAIATTSTVTSSGSNLGPAVIGMTIVIPGAGAAGARYAGVITGVASAGSITVLPAIGTTVTTVRADIGTTNEVAYTAARAAATATGRALRFPIGTYLVINTGAFGALVFDRGAVLAVSNQVVISVNGQIDADPDAQIFSNPLAPANGGTVTIAAFSQGGINAEWWGTGTSYVDAGLATSSQNEFRVGRVHRFRPESVVTMVNGANDNLPAPTTELVEVIGPTGAYNFSGIAPLTGQSVGYGNEYEFIFAAAQTVTIKHEAQSATANQFVSPTGADIVLAGGGHAMRVRYTGAFGKWFIVSYV